MYFDLNADAFLSQRASFVRHQFEDQGMPVVDAPDDDEVRQTYNFAPGYHGLVYRADVPDYGAGNRHQRQHRHHEEDEVRVDDGTPPPIEEPKETRYKLQAMKWGASHINNIYSASCSLQWLNCSDRTCALLDQA